jgi:hypothetical protein
MNSEFQECLFATYPEMFKHIHDKYILSSQSLLDKYGFRDGDLFSDFVHENYIVNWTTQEFAMDKQVLKMAVERYLMPSLPVPIRLQCFITCHNNVRVHPDAYDELSTQSETSVEITEEQLRELCEEVKHEYMKEQ